MDTNTTSSYGRMHLTERLDERLKPFLIKEGFLIQSWGRDITLKKNTSMRALINKLIVKKSEAALMVKFCPDIICIKKGSKNALFFLDTKTSITPVCFKARIETLRVESRLSKLDREDILAIEREAWDTYNNSYPPESVILIIGCPYNPRLLLAEKVSNIMCLHRFKKDTNPNAGGSHTPYVDIHLGKMRSLDVFLKEEFGIKVNKSRYEKILNFIKRWNINKPAGTVNWSQYHNVIKELRKTCPWIKKSGYKHD